MERTAGRYLALLLAFVMVLTGSGQVFAVDTADTADSPSEIVEEVAPEESPDSSVLEESIRLDRKLGQVTIQLAADSGMLPVGTELNIEQIKVKGTLAESFLDSRFKNYLVYDISLKDEEGNEVQPDGGVDLSFLNLPFDGLVEVLYLEDRWLEKAKDSKGTFSEPVHDLEVLDTDIASDEVVVTTDHFSIYVVGEYSLATYQFNADNVFISEQVVKNGDLLVEPASPNKEGHKFTGWYVEGEDSPIDFSEPVAFSNDEDFTLQVHAGFTAVYYVYFIYDGDIVTTKEVVPGETTDAHDITLIVSEPGWALDYWSVTANGQPFDFANTPINENLKLYAVTVEGWEVYFNTQGGTQVLPKYIPFNQPKENQIGTFQLPTPPTRQGYTFQGWNDKADGTGNSFGAGTLINSSHVDGQGVLHLYAIWRGQTGISYSLVYWQENADDDGYSYVATVGRTGRAGDTIIVADADRRPNRYTYFSYKEYDSNVRIKGDGSAIVNIYYSRIVYELEFNLNRDNSTLTIGGTTYTHPETYSFKAKYNADISHLWPTADHIPNDGSYYFRGWTTSSSSDTYVSKRMNLTPELFNSNQTVKTFTGSWINNPTTYHLRYMIETLNGNIGDGSGGALRQYGSKWYQESLPYSQTVQSSSNSNWNAKEIAGVTSVNSTAQSDGSYRYFYYDRLSYDLTFHNPGQIQTNKLKFGTNLSGMNFTPNHPTGMPSSYIFEGWYTDAGGAGNKFEFAGAVMPEKNLALYARWTPPTHILRYYDQPGGNLITISDLPNGEPISIDDLTEKKTPSGLEPENFVGWFWTVGTAFVRFDFDLPIERDDIILHPVWETHNYNVTYDLGGAEGVAPVDEHAYKLGAAAYVLPLPSSVEPPSDAIGPMVFLGWQLEGTSKVFQPNDKVGISGNLTLIARWGENDVERRVQLVYQGNGGLDSDSEPSRTIGDLINNASHQVIPNPFSYEGYAFDHWNTSPDGSGSSFSPGDSLAIVDKENEETENILYAIWINIAVEKTGEYIDVNGDGYFNVGDRVDYSVKVTNTGFYRLQNIALQDDLVNLVYSSGDTNNDGYLDTDEEWIYTGTYLLTQADIDRGTVTNHVTATGKGIVFTVSAEDEDTVKVAPAPELEVKKVADLGSAMYAGETVTYTIKVKNTGNVTLTGIEITDDKLAFSETIASLAPGETVTRTVTYTLLQTDIDGGSIENTAAATGTDPFNTEVGHNDTITTELYQHAALKIEKNDSITEDAVVGDIITYTIRVTNTGNVTLHGIDIEDGLVNFEETGIELAPGGYREYEVYYTLVQADFDRGSVVNTATAEGEDPDGNEVSDDVEITTTMLRNPDLEVIKDGTYVDVNGNGKADVGDRIDYTITVTNTGNVTLHNILVVDDMIDLDEEIPELLPGAVVTYTGSYVLTQGDLNNGSVINTVELEVDEIDDPKEPTEETELTQKPGLAIEKTADVGDAPKAGDVISYTITVTNTGNVTLYNIHVVDALLGLDATIDILSPDDDPVTLTGNYQLTQADLDRGLVVNKATAEGEDPNEDEVKDDVEISTPLTQTPDLEVIKTGVYVDVNDNSKADVGDRIHYTITVTNTGNVTLHNILVVDDMIDLDEEILVLLPGATETFTGSYEFTQADLDNGSVINTIELEVDEIDEPEEPTEETPLTQAPDLLIEKIADIGDASVAGDTISYTIKVTNTGNVTLFGIRVIDDLVGLDTTITELVPGVFWEHEVTYTLTQADLDAGQVNNKATAIGKTKDGRDVEDEIEISTPLGQSLGLEIHKESELGDAIYAGDIVFYTISVKNTGNVTLYNIAIDDEKLGFTDHIDSIVPGQTVNRTVPYTLKQTDIDQGFITNAATVAGEDLGGTKISDDTEITTDLYQSSTVKIEKIASVADRVGEGDTISYIITVTNTGNVTLYAIRVVDDLVGLDMTIAELAPGVSEEYEVSYTLLQADLDAGQVINEATAIGKDPKGEDVEAEVEISTPLAKNPDLEVKKTGVYVDVNANGKADVGDRIDYTITVTNTGNVTLHNILVVDDMIDLDEEILELLPGVTVTLTGSYQFTQADLDNGSVLNTIELEVDEIDEPEEPTEETSLTQEPGLLIEKTANIGNAQWDGDRISYTITVTNTGNVTLYNIRVLDDLLGLDETIDVLAPGDDPVTFTGSYRLTQADLDRGFVVNEAFAAGHDPKGGEVGDTDKITTTLPQNPDLLVRKTGVYIDVNMNGIADIGDRIDYTITVINKGNVTLHNVWIVDDMLGLNKMISILEPFESFTFDGSYQITQEDLDKGSVINTVELEVNEIDDPDEPTEITPLTQVPGLAIVKTADIGNASKAGDEIEYTITVTNTGNVTLYSIRVVDDLVGLDTTITELAPGASKEYVVSYTLLQADLDAGQVVNEATAVGKDPKGEDVETEVEISTPLVKNPDLEVKKTGVYVDVNANGKTDVGDRIDYTITVTNTGNVTLHNILVVDDMIDLDEEILVLLPGAVVTYTGSYVLTQGDLNKGSVINTVELEVDEIDEPEEPTETTPLTQVPGLTIEKMADIGGASKAGDEIEYTITVTNTGNVTLYGIRVVDDLLGLDTTILELAPGNSEEYVLSYTLLQKDLDAGQVVNEATAEGKDPNGEEINDEIKITTPLVQNPDLLVEKTGVYVDVNANGRADAGDRIDYTITVTNIGNVTLHNILVVDDMIDLDEEILVLLPGAVVTYTGSYVLTQGDLNNGSVINTVELKVDEIDEPDKPTEETPLTQVPGLMIEKTADIGNASKAGDKIEYTITVTNTGNVTLYAIHVVDDRVGLDTTIVELAPGESKEYVIVYTLLQTDLDAGQVVNEATVEGKDRNDEEINDEVKITTPLVQNPDLLVEKTGVYVDVNDNGKADVGDRIDYTITVTNTGNVTLHNILVVDDLIDLDEEILVLLPGATVTYTGSYVLTQTDLNKGSVINTVELEVDEIDEPDEPTEETPLTQEPGLTIKKTAAIGQASKAGDSISYTIKVTNTGNVTLYGIHVLDDLVGLDMTILELAPGNSEEYVLSYTLLQSDLDRGFIINEAAAAGETPDGEDIDARDAISTPLPQNPDLLVEKTGVYVDVNANGRADVGDRIDYTITVTNTGNVTLHNILVVDDMIDLDEEIPELLPGAVVTYTGSYVLTQADLNNGSVINTVELEVDEIDEPEEPTEETPLTQVPGLMIEKTADIGDAPKAGDEIEYTITVTNTGNVTLYAIRVVDDLVGLDTTITQLAPGASREYVVSYTLLQKDLDAGQVVNDATVEGKDPNGEDVDSQVEITTPLTRNPDLSIIKSADIGDASKAGDEIEYTITVTNTGNVTLYAIRVVDALLGIDETIDELAPGDDPVKFTGSHQLTQEDLNRGYVVNKATAEGEDPHGEKVTAEVEIETSLDKTPALEIAKTGLYVDVNGNGVADFGDRIDYTITVTNTGNVTLYDIRVLDALLDLDATIDELHPGDDPVVLTGSYAFTQEDLDAGLVANRATAEGQDPDGDAVTGEVEIETPLLQEPDLEVLKTGVYVDVNDNGRADVGDRIDYSITVTNTGNITLHGVLVVDEMIGLDELIDVLKPGVTMTFTGNYEFTQEDLDRGSVVNTVELAADEIEEPEEPTEITPLEQEPSLQIEKFADIGSAARAGDEISYTIRVTNTGNVTLYGILVEDELVELSETIEELAPGESVDFTATYVLTQANLDAGRVDNLASAVGDDPAGQPVGSETEITTELAYEPEIQLRKEADREDYSFLGEVITYTYTVTNAGNVTLVGPFTVTDDRIDQADFDLENLPDSLAPGQSFQVTALYRVSQEDLDRGHVTNRALASGFFVPAGGEGETQAIPVFSEEAVLTLPADQKPSFSVEKEGTYVDADQDGYLTVGDRIDYKITVVNTGNISLTRVRVVDAMLDLDFVIDTLAVGEVWTYQDSYALTQKDIDRGFVRNVVMVGADEVEQPSEKEEVTDLDGELPPVPVPPTGETLGYPLMGSGIILMGMALMYIALRRRKEEETA